MSHVEEREFQVVLHLRAEFPEDYAGQEDGFAWHERFQAELRPALLRALTATLRAAPHVSTLPSPRGRDPESCVELEVRFTPRP